MTSRSGDSKQAHQEREKERSSRPRKLAAREAGRKERNINLGFGTEELWGASRPGIEQTDRKFNIVSASEPVDRRNL